MPSLITKVLGKYFIDPFWPILREFSAKALDATLKAWEHGGSGEMGGHIVDVVGLPRCQ
jgi:hypothetical protein